MIKILLLCVCLLPMWSSTWLVHAADQPAKDPNTYVEYTFNDFPGNKDWEARWRQGPGKYAEGVGAAKDTNDKALLFDDATLNERVLHLYIPFFTVDGMVDCFIYPAPQQTGSATVLSTGSAGNTVLMLKIIGNSLIPQASITTKKKCITVISNTSLKPNTWSHVAVTWSSTSPMPYLRVFINGKMTGSIADDVTPWNIVPNILWVGSMPLWEGKEVWYTDMNFTGRIDDLRFSRKPKTAEAITGYLKKYYPLVIQPAEAQR